MNRDCPRRPFGKCFLLCSRCSPPLPAPARPPSAVPSSAVVYPTHVLPGTARWTSESNGTAACWLPSFAQSPGASGNYPCACAWPPSWPPWPGLRALNGAREGPALPQPPPLLCLRAGLCDCGLEENMLRLSLWSVVTNLSQEQSIYSSHESVHSRGWHVLHTPPSSRAAIANEAQAIMKSRSPGAAKAFCELLLRGSTFNGRACLFKFNGTTAPFRRAPRRVCEATDGSGVLWWSVVCVVRQWACSPVGWTISPSIRGIFGASDQ